MATENASPDSAADPLRAEPGRGTPAAGVGGVKATADSGVADWAQRSTERGEDPPLGPATTGGASGAAAEPRLDLGGKNAPGSAPGPSAAADRPASDTRATAPVGATAIADRRAGTAGTTRGYAVDDEADEDEWRHEPVAPVDETDPLKSLGEAVADTITGPSQDTPGSPDGPQAPQR